MPTLLRDSVRPVTTDLGLEDDGAYILVERLPHGSAWQREDLGSRFALSQSEFEALLATLPVRLPPQAARLDEAALLVGELQALGFVASLEFGGGTQARCKAHPRLAAVLACKGCGKLGCPLCVKGPAPSCSSCQNRHRFRRGFFLLRLSVLLTVLVLVGVWGYRDSESRSARHAWDRTLSVAVVLVTPEVVAPDSVRKLESRLRALEDQLESEFLRYRRGPQPFRFVLLGPTQAALPPAPPANDGFLELAWFSARQWAHLFNIDYRVGLDTASYDSRIYLVARAPATESQAFVEGYGEHGGRVGIVQVELDDSMVDLVLTVIAHELMHTLGAEDKYDARGNARFPEGLAEPDAHPVYPQHFVEIMARNRPITASHSVSLTSLAELRVGPSTAREIGWTRDSGTRR